MNKIDQAITDFKIELSQEWRTLQKHKYRRPKYMNIPRSLSEDPRWIKLSPEAAKALITILLIAGENRDNNLPNPEMLYLRLRAIGQCFYRSKFSALIDELNQYGFILKTTPELQSLRVTEIQKDKKEEDLKNGCPIKEGESLNHLAQPHLNGSGNSKFVPPENLAPKWSTPRFWEITGTVEANRIRTEFEKRPGAFRVVLEGGGHRGRETDGNPCLS